MSLVLGLDPGSYHLGYGLVESTGSRLRHVGHGTLSARRGQPLPQRLASLYDGLSEVVQSHRPDHAAAEKVFTAHNVASALTLGHARGVALLTLGQADLELAEYSPSEVKLAVGGHGRSGKDQVARMVARLLEIPTEGMGPDSTDALAVAICHCHGLARARLLARAQKTR